jgi:RNA polymerase sigma-70 factor (ECF subfamily)
MELRRRRAAPVEEGAFDADGVAGPGPAPDVVYERDEVQRQVREALMGLSEKDREAVILYYLDERTVEEVGRFLGVSGGAVKGRLHRARQHLRKELIGMVEKTLSQKRLGPEFAEKVYLRTFSDLGQLTDEELSVLVHHFEQDTTDMAMSLVYALHRDDPETKTLQDRILKILPERQREFFRLRLKYSDPVRHFRGKVLTVVYDLQEKGLIRPRPGAPSRKLPEGTVEIEQFSDIAKMTDEEFWWVLCKVDTVDLAAALMSEEPGVEKVRARCYDNVSERVRSFLEFPLNIAEERVRACQEGILKIVHQMQEAGEIRASKKG